MRACVRVCTSAACVTTTPDEKNTGNNRYDINTTTMNYSESVRPGSCSTSWKAFRPRKVSPSFSSARPRSRASSSALRAGEETFMWVAASRFRNQNRHKS